jgi:hypothetical protein
MRIKPPIETYFLLVLLIFLSLCGIYGGISLIIDSTGNQLNLSFEGCFYYPFKSFLTPGIIVFLVFGILPLLLIIPLVKKPNMNWANVFNIYHRRHWSWTYTLFLGIFLVVWVNLQIWMIGYQSSIQILQSFYGLAIIFFCLLPEQIKFSSTWKMRKPESIKPQE